MMPIIALPPQISPKHGTAYMNHEYCDAIIRAGGLPLILPLSADKAILRRYAAESEAFRLRKAAYEIYPR